MGPQRGRGPIHIGSQIHIACSEGLFAVGPIEFLDHLVG